MVSDWVYRLLFGPEGPPRVLLYTFKFRCLTCGEAKTVESVRPEAEWFHQCPGRTAARA